MSKLLHLKSQGFLGFLLSLKQATLKHFSFVFMWQNAALNDETNIQKMCFYQIGGSLQDLFLRVFPKEIKNV